MTSKEYAEWYTHHEIRQLEDESLNEGPLSHYCSHPHLAIHPYFKMCLEGYSDINNNKLQPLLETLWPDKNNVTLIFVGDSLTRNRINFFFKDVKRILGDHFEHGMVPIKNLDEPVPGDHLSVILYNRQTNQKILLHEAHLTINEFNITTGVYYGNAANIINYVNLVEKRNALIMLTMGAWFNDESKFLSQMTPVVSWLQTLAQRKSVKNKVVWMSAMPQHFDSINGYYSGWGPGSNGEDVENHCKPRINDDPKRDWRNELLRQHLHNISDQYIEMFDDRDIYIPLYSHHSANKDCTHYCYHPIVQMPLYENMTRWLKHFDK